MSAKKTLGDLEKEIPNLLQCPLKASATNLVFGRGNPNARIFIIGEAPGKKEDEQGLPFVGSAGKKLNILLQNIELSLDDVYIANILKYRPPKNRNPTIDEITRHTPYLLEQIRIIKPNIILPLGNFATKFVLSEFTVSNMKNILGISQIHGQAFTVTIDSRDITVIPLYHPAALLYKPSLQEEMNKDLLQVKKNLK